MKSSLGNNLHRCLHQNDVHAYTIKTNLFLKYNVVQLVGYILQICILKGIVDDMLAVFFRIELDAWIFLVARFCG